MNEDEKNIQFGIFIIQWYAEYTGLKLNMDKTSYQIFKKKKIEEKDKLKLHFWKDVYKQSKGYKKTELVEVKETKKAVRYLGYWFDSKLNWKAHRETISKSTDSTL